MQVRRWGYAILLALPPLLLLSFQYPLSVSFPLGNDTVSYLERSHHFLDLAYYQGNISQSLFFLFGQTNYPASIAAISLFSLLPIDPPLLFMLAMAFTHILVGVTIVFFMHRLFSPLAGSLAGFFWALSFLLNHHVSNGVFGHLLSLLPFLLTLFFLIRRKWLLVHIFYWLTYFFHPFSGFFLFLVFVADFILSYFASGRKVDNYKASHKHLLYLVLGTMGLFFVAITYRKVGNVALTVDRHFVSIIDLLTSYFLPIWIVAAVGVRRLFILCGRAGHVSRQAYLLLFSLTISIALTFNNFLGLSFMVRRFESYFLLFTCCVAGLGMTYFVHGLSGKFTKSLLLGVFVAGLTAQAIFLNSAAYAHEDLDVYGRLARSDVEGLIRLRESSAKNAFLLVVGDQRRARWVSVLSNRRTVRLPNANHWSEVAMEAYIDEHQYSYIVFLYADGAIDGFDYQFFEKYTTVYSKGDLIIKNLRDESIAK